MTHNQRYNQAKKVTMLGGATNIILGVIKIIGGKLCHSHALIADGIHSFSDVLTDLMVLFASKYGGQDADLKHPYGHQRIETAATLLLSLLLILAGVGIAWDACLDILNPHHTPSTILGLPIALLSIILNEVFYHYTLRIGKKIRSDLLITNAWHHRSDAGASCIVLLGLIGSMYGWKLLDPIAAIIIGGLIIKMGISYGWQSVNELIDTAVDSQTLLEVEKLIQSIDGVQKIHQLRSRRMGQDIFIDLHIQVSPWISVSEGHFIAQNVHYSLLKHNPEIKDVTIHVDPEDDEAYNPSINLPTRYSLENNLLRQLQKKYPSIQDWKLHYIDGALHIEIILDNNCHQLDEIKQQLQQDCAKHACVINLQFLSYR